MKSYVLLSICCALAAKNVFADAPLADAQAAAKQIVTQSQAALAENLAQAAAQSPFQFGKYTGTFWESMKGRPETGDPSFYWEVKQGKAPNIFTFTYPIPASGDVVTVATVFKDQVNYDVLTVKEDGQYGDKVGEGTCTPVEGGVACRTQAKNMYVYKWFDNTATFTKNSIKIIGKGEYTWAAATWHADLTFNPDQK